MKKEPRELRRIKWMERRLLLLSDWCREHADRLASRRYREFPVPPAEAGSINRCLQEESHRLTGRIVKKVDIKTNPWKDLPTGKDWPDQMSPRA